MYFGRTCYSLNEFKIIAKQFHLHEARLNQENLVVMAEDKLSQVIPQKVDLKGSKAGYTTIIPPSIDHVPDTK